MSQQVLSVPEKLIVSNLASFCEAMNSMPPSDVYLFDFERTTWAEPFGMLYLSNMIKDFKKSRNGSVFMASNYKHLSYPGHMGFFQSFGLDFGKNVGEASGNSHYLPITTMTTAPLIREAAASADNVAKKINDVSSGLAKILTQNDESDIVGILSYSFREMIRNVFEHSKSTELDYCAQYWPTKSKVEISIIDRGVGIRTSLNENPHVKLDNDKEALELCVVPGVSSKMFKGVAVDRYNPWQNSGFGLYMAKRLCSCGGSFLICSGSSGIIWSGDSQRDFSISIQGTAVRMKMELAKLNSVSGLIETFIAEGEKIAKKYSDAGVHKASCASRVVEF